MLNTAIPISLYHHSHGWEASHKGKSKLYKFKTLAYIFYVDFDCLLYKSVFFVFVVLWKVVLLSHGCFDLINLWSRVMLQWGCWGYTICHYSMKSACFWQPKIWQQCHLPTYLSRIMYCCHKVLLARDEATWDQAQWSYKSVNKIL